MRLKDWLKIFESFKSRGIKVLHTSSLEAVTGMKERGLAVVLTRLEDIGIIRRMSKGWIYTAM